jgi:hypothetical protein
MQRFLKKAILVLALASAPTAAMAWNPTNSEACLKCQTPTGPCIQTSAGYAVCDTVYQFPTGLRCLSYGLCIP